MTLPNLFSASRIALTPIMIFLLLAGRPGGTFIAAILLILAGITDSFDGYLARRFKQVSTLGIFLDLTADKVLVSGVMLTLVYLQAFPAWVAGIIIGRELIITALRIYAASSGLIVPAQGWGKGKTVVTLIALVCVMLREDLWAGGSIAMLNVNGVAGFLLNGLAWPLILLATALTVVSGLSYILNVLTVLSGRKNRRDAPGSGVTVLKQSVVGKSQLKRVTTQSASSVYRLYRKMREVW